MQPYTRQMTREKRPDEIARELAPEPTEPLGTRLTTIGRAFSPTGQQVFGYIQTSGPTFLKAGERVEVVYYRADQESFKYVARRVRRIASADG